MQYLTAAQFRYLLRDQPLDSLVREYVFRGTPYAFRERPAAFEAIRTHLCTHLPLVRENIIVVGSGKTGFSLNPATRLRKFSTRSDIDVLVVDQTLFDRVWLALVEWQHPRRLTELPKEDREWASLRRKDIYWGWLSPTEIRYRGLFNTNVLAPLSEISGAWFDTFQGLSLYADYQEFSARSVSGRLYRTWDHALLYHREGLRSLRDEIWGVTEGV